MLRAVKTPGLKASHDYPKRMLAYMLIMAYWIKIKHVTFDVMEGNMYLFMEEYGEIFFSTLARCVLGDTIKADFDHMNKIYKLLPVYRDVQSDIKSDTNRNADSITWHHTIPTDSPEVAAAAFFFNRTITQIVNGTYKSYTRKAKYGTMVSEVSEVTKDYTPIIFNPDIADGVQALCDSINKDISGNWVNSYSDMWPSDDLPDDSDAQDDNGDNKSGDDTSGSGSESEYVPWEDCIEGQYAVTISEYEEIGAICVYKVIDKGSVPINASEGYATFTATEWVCTIDNSTEACIKKGRWHKPQRQTSTETVYNWCVIAYFERLENGRLPKVIADAVTARNSAKKIFS